MCKFFKFNQNWRGVMRRFFGGWPNYKSHEMWTIEIRRQVFFSMHSRTVVFGNKISELYRCKLRLKKGPFFGRKRCTKVRVCIKKSQCNYHVFMQFLATHFFLNLIFLTKNWSKSSTRDSLVRLPCFWFWAIFMSSAKLIMLLCNFSKII